MDPVPLKPTLTSSYTGYFTCLYFEAFNCNSNENETFVQ